MHEINALSRGSEAAFASFKSHRQLPMTALRGAAVVGLLATHALAGQPLNATTAVNYTRCVFQFVYGKTCAHEGRRNNKFFKDGPTASQAEAFALCDADPECDAVQQYGDKALINNNETAWAEPCGADICYMKCHDLGKDACGRTMLEEADKNGKEGRRLFDVDDEILLDDADVEDAMLEYEERRLYYGPPEDEYESPAQQVYTCRPYEEEPGIRSPVAFSLFLIAAILGGPLVYFVGVKLSRRYNCKKDGKCGLLEWSRFSCVFGAIWLIIGFGLLAGYFGPQDDDCEGDVLLYLGISFTSFAGFLLVVALWMAQVWWRSHRKQDMKVTPQRRQSRAVSAFSAAAIAPAPVSCRPGWTAHQNIGTPKGQGDVEIILYWRKKHSLDELMRKVEQNGYSAISVGKFHQAVLKKFPYQLTADHCKPVQGYTNTFYIWSGGGSGMVAPATDTGIGFKAYCAKENMKVSADASTPHTDPYKVQLAADLIMARRAKDKNAAERVVDALGGGEHGMLQAFMVLDKDTNGYVTATELRRVIPTNVPVAEVNAMLREADLEDDGRLNYEEFIRFVDPKGESWSRTMSVIKAIGKQAKATPEAEPIMTTVVTGTVVEAEPAREPPPLHDIVDALKKNLGLDGTWPEVVDAACLQLGVAPTGSLQEKADECWRAMEG